MIPLMLLALAVAYAAPVFSPLTAVHSGDAVKDFDWLKIAAFEHHARQSLAQGGLAFWCPYFGGGYPLVAHPEDASLSPLTLPSYLVGEAVGMKIQFVLALFFGAWGIFLVARRVFAQSIPAAVTAAVALLFSGWMAWRLHYGWPMHFGYFLFPFAFYFLVRAVEDLRWLLAATAVMVVILQQIAQGLPFFFLFLLAWALSVDIARRKQRPRFGRTLLVIALTLLTALAGAVKTAGLLRLLAANPRAVPYELYQPLEHFYAGLGDWLRFLVFEQDVYFKNIGLGPWLVFLALAGLIFAFRRLWPLLPGFVLFIWIGLGPNAPVDLFAVLHRLPVFGSMHWPMKYVNFFIAFTVCLLAGGAIDFIVRRTTGRWRVVVAAVGIVPLIPLAMLHMRLLDASFTQSDPPPTARGEVTEFRQIAAYPNAPRGAGRPEAATMYWAMLRNQGVIDWDGDLLLPENAVPAERVMDDGSRVPVPEYRGEVWFEGEGAVDSFEVGVNRFRVTGTAESLGWLIVNQNYDPAWCGTPGEVQSADGLLAMPVNPGPFEALFVYRPTWFFTGLAISLLTWLVLGLFWWSETRRLKQ